MAVLAEGRRDSRRLVRELAPFWLLGALYLGAKILFLRVLPPRWHPLQATFFLTSYGLSFEPLPALERLGRYAGAAVAPLYAPGPPATWCRVVGALTVGLTALVVAAWWLTGARRWLGVMAWGLVLFLMGLGPVLFLSDHFYPAYVGIAALGTSLAIVAPFTALPRGSTLALALATTFVAVHVGWTATAARSEEAFRTVEGLSVLGPRWLRAVEQAAGPDTRTVLVPLDTLTARLFGVAHRLFLCAPYEVRPQANLERVTPQPGVVVVPLPAESGPDPLHEWRSIVRPCSP
jgi:hypothetical protein